jgi:Bax protein
MSVTTKQGSVGISYGSLATSVALFVFLTMLVFLGDRWSAQISPLPDFGSYKQVKEMKAAFIDYMLPIINYHNTQILNQRKRLEKVHRAIELGTMASYSELKWLKQLANRYGVEWDEDEPVVVTQELLTRVDIVPVQLAVVQAAKESSWGRSRYAVQINNLFGQWCYIKGCGVIPQERPKGARHEVRKFQSVSDSTRSYIHNLNSHRNYSNLRMLRRNLRAEGRSIEGSDLVDGLLFYSERRQQYVDEIRSMIKQYSYFIGQQANPGRAVKGV